MCVWCGNTKNLNADHIKSYAKYPEFRYDLSNGRVLCEDCHRKTETYGKKNN
jgi:5-methylcytosine-specific restriction endonuclease McrA